MKKVKCSVCGITTNKFIRYEKVPYCTECFFSFFNYCEACRGIFPYVALKPVDGKDGLEYYCKECYEMVVEHCAVCGMPIPKGRTMAITDGLNAICEDCLKKLDKGY